MFDRSVLYGLSNQLSFNVPVAGSESNIKTAQYRSDGRAVDKDLRVAGSTPAHTPCKGDMFIGFLRKDDVFISKQKLLGRRNSVCSIIILPCSVRIPLFNSCVVEIEFADMIQL